MPVVSICAGAYCAGREVAQEVARRLDYRLEDDQSLARLAVQQGLADLPALKRTLAGKKSIFDRFCHEQQRCLAALNLAMSKLVADDRLVFLGLAALLIPPRLPQVLKVCLIADTGYRLERAMQKEGLSRREARQRLERAERAAAFWGEQCRGKDPWSPELYDIFLPMDRRQPREAAALICRHARSAAVALGDQARRAVRDYALAALVQAALAQQGHMVQVEAHQGGVRITVNQRVLRFDRLARELEDLARQVPGVKEVEVVPGPKAHKADIYRAADFEAPRRVLLVDDEREFAEALSERLTLRHMNAVVANDGQEALELVEQEEPEVMVLDLMLPGLDGMEVLREIKHRHPRVEVVVLTGHGSPQDQRACLEAGAFAYLQKPVEVEELSEVLRRAYRKVRQADGDT